MLGTAVHKSNTPEKAARFASLANTFIAGTQATAAIVFGNLGFAVEAAHNLSDAVSFDTKRRAMGRGLSERVAKRWRNIGANILTFGGYSWNNWGSR